MPNLEISVYKSEETPGLEFPKVCILGDVRCNIQPVQQEIIWKWPKCLEDQLCDDLWPLTSKTFHPNSKVSIKRLSASAICSSTPDKSSIFPPERSDRRPARLQGRQATNLDACAAPAPTVRTIHVCGLPIQIQLGAQSPCLTSELPVFCRAAAGVFLTAQTTALLQQGAELILSREERGVSGWAAHQFPVRDICGPPSWR